MELTLEQMQAASLRRHNKKPRRITDKERDNFEMVSMEWVLRADMKMIWLRDKNAKPAKKTPHTKKVSKRARNKVDFDRVAAAAAGRPYEPEKTEPPKSPENKSDRPPAVYDNIPSPYGLASDLLMEQLKKKPG